MVMTRWTQFWVAIVDDNVHSKEACWQSWVAESRADFENQIVRLLYRIHGTNEPWTIGTNVSSGCIRLTNEDVVDLYNRAPIGAKVIVFGTRQTGDLDEFGVRTREITARE